MSWIWLLTDENGATVAIPDDLESDATFHTQADAETWIGENWQELHDNGVAAVTLTASGTKIYGPMSLEAG